MKFSAMIETVKYQVLDLGRLPDTSAEIGSKRVIFKNDSLTQGKKRGGIIRY